MCIRVISHWEPCNDQRLTSIEICKNCIATPGLSAIDCPDGDNVYPPKPAEQPCPVCERRNDFQKLDAQDNLNTDVAKWTEPMRQVSTRSGLPLSDASSTILPDISTVSEASCITCDPGSHALQESRRGGLVCVKCGHNASTVRFSRNATDSTLEMSPWQAFTDDEDAASVQHAGPAARDQSTGPGSISIYSDIVPASDCGTTRVRERDIPERGSEAVAASMPMSTLQAWRDFGEALGNPFT